MSKNTKTNLYGLLEVALLDLIGLTQSEIGKELKTSEPVSQNAISERATTHNKPITMLQETILTEAGKQIGKMLAETLVSMHADLIAEKLNKKKE